MNANLQLSLEHNYEMRDGGREKTQQIGIQCTELFQEIGKSEDKGRIFIALPVMTSITIHQSRAGEVACQTSSSREIYCTFQVSLTARLSSKSFPFHSQPARNNNFCQLTL